MSTKLSRADLLRIGTKVGHATGLIEASLILKQDELFDGDFVSDKKVLDYLNTSLNFNSTEGRSIILSAVLEEEGIAL